MVERVYTEYEKEESDNQAAGSALVTRFPEGWAGDRVNGAMAAMGSAVRNLGDRTLFAPVDGDGNTVGQQAGTLALQDADSVIFTGGVVDGLRGAVPVGTVIFYGATFETYTANITPLFNSGWVICDGRTITSPLDGSRITVPSLIGLYPFFGSTDAITQFGSFTQTTSAAGTHSHGAVTGAAGTHAHGGLTSLTQLLTENMPDSVLTDFSIGGSGGNQGGGTQAITKVRAGTGTPHGHFIGSDGNHQHAVANDGSHSHTVTVQPPSIKLIPLIRAF
jgi:hypothetical protein